MKIRHLFSPLPFFLILFISSCHPSNNNSADDEIFRQPVFSILSDSISKMPGNDALYFRRAILLNKHNYPVQALHDFEKAWSIKKDELYALGIARLWMDRNPDSAILFINDALKIIPGSFLLRLQLARSYDALGKTDEALAACNDIIRQDTTNADVLRFEAGLLDKKDSSSAALKVLEAAWKLTPNDAELNYLLAERYAENKDPKTLSFCDAIIRKDSQHVLPQPYYYKGLYFSNIREWDKALAAFNATIEKDFHYMPAYTEKGRVLMEENKTMDAMKVFQLANTVDPAYPDAYFWLGKCQESLGKKEDALLNYQRAYSLDKSFTQAKEAADALHNK